MGYGVQQCSFQTLASLERFGLAGSFKGVLQFFIETLDLAPSGFGLFSALPGAGGKLTDCQRGNEEGSQSHPVLWICNGESVKRRKKEKIETEHGKYGIDERGSTPGA